jgi:hypothetical protein
VAGIALYGAPLIVGNVVTYEACLGVMGEIRTYSRWGSHTATNIQSGMIYGWAGLVDGLVERMRREMKGDVKVVAGGGGPRALLEHDDRDHLGALAVLNLEAPHLDPHHQRGWSRRSASPSKSGWGARI